MNELYKKNCRVPPYSVELIRHTRIIRIFINSNNYSDIYENLIFFLIYLSFELELFFLLYYSTLTEDLLASLLTSTGIVSLVWSCALFRLEISFVSICSILLVGSCNQCAQSYIVVTEYVIIIAVRWFQI